MSMRTMVISSALVIATGTRASAQGAWIERAKLTTSDAANDDYLGAVSIGAGMIAIGTAGDDFGGFTDAGSVRVFVGGGSTWTAQALPVVAPTPQDGAEFGYRVALSGSTLVVGAWLETRNGQVDAGAAYVYEWNGATWQFAAKLPANAPAGGDLFGASVAIDVDTIVVGAPGDDAKGSDSGAVHVFGRNQGGSNTWGHVVTLTASDGAASNSLGEAVAIDGDRFVVGATGNDPIGGGQDRGAAYVFARNGATWAEETKLVASDAAIGDYFGWSVAMNGDTAIVGAPEEENAGSTDTGSAYVFVRDPSNGAWTEQTKLEPCGGQDLDGFGESVAVVGDVAVVGSPHADPPNLVDPGMAYVFERAGTSWQLRARLTAIDAQAGAGFGAFVAASPTTIAVDAALDDRTGATDAGAVYTFELVTAGTVVCAGNGIGTPCPCSNDGCGDEGCANATAYGARLYNRGGISATLDDADIVGIRFPPNRSALLFMGQGQAPLPFGDGILCPSAPFKRFAPQNTGSSGAVAQSQIVAASGGLITSGSTWTLQAWCNDPSGPCGAGFNSSNGLQITFN